MKGCFFGGELWYLGGRGLKSNYLCGCGKPFLECEMWTEVVSHLRQEIGEPGRLLLESIPTSLVRTRSLLTQTVLARLGVPSQPEADLLDVLERLYLEIAAVSRASVIIDTSKSPMYARLLERIPGVQLHVVHLVRDPRATGYSMRRRKFDPAGKRFLPQHGSIGNGVLWLTWNLATEILWNHPGSRVRYLRIRYEDFVRRPGEYLRSIVAFAGQPGDAPLISDRGEVVIGPTHSVSGNPIRMSTGLVQIALDDEWRSKMAWQHKAAAVLLTWPLLLRYGYRLWE